MTSFRHQTAVLALVAAGLFPSVTIASPDSGTVGRQATGTGGKHMGFEYGGPSPGVEAGNRAGALPNENKYRPVILGQWIGFRATKDQSRSDEKMMHTITQALANPHWTYYKFGAPNAGFEIDARHLGRDGLGSQVAFMLRQDVKTPEEFQRLKQTTDPVTNKPYISPKAEWKGEGMYPVGAFLAIKAADGQQIPLKVLNPYDYVDDSSRLSFKNKRTGDPEAVVEIFGLKRDQAGVAHGQVRADFQEDFPGVQGRSGLSNVFGGLFGSGQQQQQQQQQQHPGQYQQQRPTNCDGPGALDGAIGGNGRGGVQINLGKIISNVAKPKPPGCE